MDTEDYYGDLGLAPSSDSRTIKRQYRLLARLYHPDVNRSPEAIARFQAVQSAYDVLGTESKRRAYDNWFLQEVALRRPVRMDVGVAPGSILRLLERQRVYTLVELAAQIPAQTTRTALNLVLVLDRSSSMKGRRLYYVKEAAKRILARLTPGDFFGIIAFNDRASVVLPAGSATNISVANGALDSLSVAGGTELAMGLQAGLREVMKHHQRNTVSHVILLTDGRTYGDEAFALDLARRAADQHVGITAMGLGNDWNDALLDQIAQEAHGASHYIARPDDAVVMFEETLAQLQRTFARNTKVRLSLGSETTLLQAHEVSPGLRALPCVGDDIALGTLSTEPPTRLLLEFAVAPPAHEVFSMGSLSLEYELVEDSRPYSVERLVVADVTGDELPKAPAEIYEAARRVATLRLQQRIWDYANDGEYERSAGELERLAHRFHELGAGDLAEATQREANQMRSTGTLSDEGRMTIKYGTRLLALPAPARTEP